jgi:hypothetical protein
MFEFETFTKAKQEYLEEIGCVSLGAGLSGDFQDTHESHVVNSKEQDPFHCVWTKESSPRHFQTTHQGVLWRRQVYEEDRSTCK